MFTKFRVSEFPAFPLVFRDFSMRGVAGWGGGERRKALGKVVFPWDSEGENGCVCHCLPASGACIHSFPSGMAV